jgi:hypothetical protein
VGDTHTILLKLENGVDGPGARMPAKLSPGGFLFAWVPVVGGARPGKPPASGPFEPTRADGLASFNPPNDKPGKFFRRAAIPDKAGTAGEEAAPELAGGLVGGSLEEPRMAAASIRSEADMCVWLLLLASLDALRLAKPCQNGSPQHEPRTFRNGANSQQLPLLVM